MHHIRAIMMSCMLWGSQLCTPSRQLYDFVESAEVRRFRRMTHDPRADGEEWVLPSPSATPSCSPRPRAARRHGTPCAEPSTGVGAMFNAARRAPPMWSHIGGAQVVANGAGPSTHGCGAGCPPPSEVGPTGGERGGGPFWVTTPTKRRSTACHVADAFVSWYTARCRPQPLRRRAIV